MLGSNSKQTGSAQGSGIVLIVDDEADIRGSLEGALRDEGFDTAVAADGSAALEAVRSKNIGVVLLDIWLPGIDGLETLRRLKELRPELPVIMMSGHATIATALTAVKLGAVEFVEKPLDLSYTIGLVRQALGSVNGASTGDVRGFTAGSDSSLEFRKPAVRPDALRGERYHQRTLARSALLYGQGLHSGAKSGLALEPLPANSGIHFVRVDSTDTVPAHVDFVSSTGFATTVAYGRTSVSTIEHLMSALSAYGITNLLVKCHGEVPVLDGSALEYCKLFDEIGTEEQNGEMFTVAVPRTLRVEGKGGEFIQIEPAEGFSIDYTLKYPAPVGEQRMTYVWGSPAEYRDVIAPCRTFGFVKDIGFLQRNGYAQGGRFDNFVLFGESGAINDKLRFPDEPVRHKILDAIGDLSLLGRRLSGKITACMTGHSDNIALLHKIRELMD